MHLRTLAVAPLFIMLVVGCGNDRNRRGGTIIRGVRDSGVTTNPRDSGVVDPGRDGGVIPGRDAGFPPGRDAGFPPGRDAGFPPARDGGSVVSDPFDPNSAAQTWATSTCQYRTRCEPAFYGFLPSSEQECIATRLQTQSVVYGVFSQMINAGRLAFNRQAFDTCMASYRTGADCVLDLDPACEQMFVGTRGVGQSCMFGEECSGGAWCMTGGLGMCGSCQAPSQNGADCSTTVCAPGLVCANAGNQTICVPNTATVNQACGDINSGLCIGRLQCINAVCQRPAANGAPCDPAQTNNPDCDIFQSSVCTNGTCQTGTWGGAGSSCNPPGLCDSTSACNNTTTMCEALPGAGVACNNGNCAPGNYCNAQNNCAAQGATGATCTAAQECQESLWCVNGTCGLLTYSPCP